MFSKDSLQRRDEKLDKQFFFYAIEVENLAIFGDNHCQIFYVTLTLMLNNNAKKG